MSRGSADRLAEIRVSYDEVVSGADGITPERKWPCDLYDVYQRQAQHGGERPRG